MISNIDFGTLVSVKGRSGLWKILSFKKGQLTLREIKSYNFHKCYMTSALLLESIEIPTKLGRLGLFNMLLNISRLKSRDITYFQMETNLDTYSNLIAPEHEVPKDQMYLFRYYIKWHKYLEL